MVFQMFNFAAVFKSILIHLKSLDKYIIKDNDETLDILLQKDADKVKFQNAVEDLLKDNNKEPRTVNLNSRTITISI